MRRCLLVFLLFVFAVPAFAQTTSIARQAAMAANLTACNKGKIPVEVVVVEHSITLTGSGIAPVWLVIGWPVAPGDCKHVYADADANEALIGFGFKDARGQFVSGKVPVIPDLGTNTYQGPAEIAALPGNHDGDKVTRDARNICVRKDATSYRTPGNQLYSVSECAALADGDAGTGPYVPLTTSLHFFPSAPSCRVNCIGGDYFINVAANPVSDDVSVIGVDATGQEPQPRDPAADARDAQLMLQAMGDVAAQALSGRGNAENSQLIAEHTNNRRRVRELADFSPAWIGQTAFARGTVSRVEASPDGQKPARVYFQDTPDFDVILPRLIANPQRYVGQRLEVRGRIVSKMYGDRPAEMQVMQLTSIFELAKGDPPDEAILPGMDPSTGLGLPGSGGAQARQTAVARPRNDQPQPAAGSPASPNSRGAGAAAPATIASIPAGTQLLVSLSDGIDLLHAADGETLTGQLAQPAPLRDGSGIIPQGSAVVIRFSRVAVPNPPGFFSLNLMVQSVSINGRALPASATNALLASPTMKSNPNLVYPAGKRLVFTIGTPAAAGSSK